MAADEWSGLHYYGRWIIFIYFDSLPHLFISIRIFIL